MYRALLIAARPRLRDMGNLPDNESDWCPLARRLAREGCLVLAYNRAPS
jgi:hypothetical protein